jgi:hypothetical protein
MVILGRQLLVAQCLDQIRDCRLGLGTEAAERPDLLAAPIRVARLVAKDLGPSLDRLLEELPFLPQN